MSTADGIVVALLPTSVSEPAPEELTYPMLSVAYRSSVGVDPLVRRCLMNAPVENMNAIVAPKANPLSQELASSPTTTPPTTAPAMLAATCAAMGGSSPSA